MLKNLWIDNRQFLLISGGGLVLFLILNSFVGDYVAEAERTAISARDMQQKVVQLHRELKDTYWAERDRVRAYEQHEKTLSEKVCLAPVTEVGDNLDLNTLQIRFQAAIAEAWSSVRQQANRAGIALPEQIDVADFGVSEDDGVVEYRTYFAYLAIVRRALEILVESSVAEFNTPEPLEPESVDVAENPSLRCVYRAVAVPVVCSYDSLGRILELAQEPGKFLQVRVRQLRPKGGSDAEGLLRAELEFVGFRIEESSEEVGRRRGRSAVPRRRRGGR